MAGRDSNPSLDDIVSALKRELGENLFSCCLYGSAVRGNFVPGVSNVNLLIVLGTSHGEAHEAIARVLNAHPKVDPFILGRRGFDRSVKSFAAKFSSIRRNYRVLCGADPLAEIVIDPELERFLCEQAMRNLRLRLVYSYVTRARHKSYVRFLAHTVTPLFLRLSEMVRLQDAAAPMAAEFRDRVELFARVFAIDASVLGDLLELKNQKPRPEEKAEEWHSRVFPLVDAALGWIEREWAFAEKPETQ